jgi:DNA modification methylase
VVKQAKTTKPPIPLRLEYLNPADLAENPANWRLHPDHQLRAIQDVISEVGWAGALLYNERTKRLIDGHARKRLFAGKARVPVLIGSWSADQEQKILATLDPIASLAQANKEALAALHEQVETGSKALMNLLAKLARENGLPAGATPPAPEPQLDRAKALQKKWKSKAGQLWEIPSKSVSGKCHRLLCGDSTKAEDVERVMAGEKAGLMNTDPPYGMSYANNDRPNPGVAKPRVAKDELRDEDLQRFLEQAFGLAASTALVENAAWYLWHAHLTQGFFAAAAAAAANVVLHRQIIWKKKAILLTRGQYHWQHEPCFMGWVKGNQPPDYGRGNGERDQSTVWELDGVPQADRARFNHATPKPVALFSIPLVKHLNAGEVAYEPFGGSGPQWVAAEQLGRLCYGIEIEPKYVAVTLERLADMGLEPRLAREA